MTRTTRPISPLRQRIIDDMCLRKLNPKTQIAYLRAVEKLARFLRQSPDTAAAEDLRRFQLCLVEQGTSSISLPASSGHSHSIINKPLSSFIINGLFS